MDSGRLPPSGLIIAGSMRSLSMRARRLKGWRLSRYRTLKQQWKNYGGQLRSWEWVAPCCLRTAKGLKDIWEQRSTGLFTKRPRSSVAAWRYTEDATIISAWTASAPTIPFTRWDILSAL